MKRIISLVMVLCTLFCIILLPVQATGSEDPQAKKDYDIFMETGSFCGLKERYEKLLINRGKIVQILGENEPYLAVALGINESGELLVRKEDGTETAVYAGEVSVRGIYGYV